MLLGACFLLRALLIAIFPETVTYLSELLPIRTPYFGTTSLSLFVAVVATEFANLFINRLKAIKRAISTSGNEFELLLSSSFFDAHLLQFTMDSGKFYIGWVKELPKPFTTSYIRITPAFSGFRNNDKELVFTTQYLTVYASYIEDGSVANTNELKTDLVLKADKINSVSFFDMDMYNRFNPVQE
ncbi:hypothetical protein GCM10011413_12270 [Pedobacter psychrotolerans]|nr:hypothetical protein GCM10011413_12270 [Pedobacter psychrotolerans]